MIIQWKYRGSRARKGRGKVGNNGIIGGSRAREGRGKAEQGIERGKSRR